MGGGQRSFGQCPKFGIFFYGSPKSILCDLCACVSCEEWLQNVTKESTYFDGIYELLEKFFPIYQCLGLLCNEFWALNTRSFLFQVISLIELVLLMICRELMLLVGKMFCHLIRSPQDMIIRLFTHQPVMIIPANRIIWAFKTENCQIPVKEIRSTYSLLRTPHQLQSSKWL